jgi:hypothetical protein
VSHESKMGKMTTNCTAALHCALSQNVGHFWIAIYYGLEGKIYKTFSDEFDGTRLTLFV